MAGLIYTYLCILLSLLFPLDAFSFVVQPAFTHEPTSRQNVLSTKKALNVPDTFGKTHFIIGFPQEECKKYSRCKTLPSRSTDNLVRQAFFSPDDDIQKQLLSFIQQEQQSIKIAIFILTDKEVAQALIQAKNRGVKIEIVTDAACIHDRYSKINLLRENGFNIFIYNPKNAKGMMSDAMHNKFVIFGNNIHNKSLIWTGSYNFTKSARLNNQENVVVLDDQVVVNKFSKHFEQLKKRCDYKQK